MTNSQTRTFAKYAMTGVLGNTFRANERDDVRAVDALAHAVPADLVARAAIALRGRDRSRDLAAMLLAHLATRDVALMERVFPLVVDDGRTLCTFVEAIRSGSLGRKSFGSAPKRALRRWFASRSPEAVFRQSHGHRSSMSDVIKMVRPPPRNDQGEADAVREALYGYLVGKNVDESSLPPLARAFEAWLRGAGPLPDLPLEMLASRAQSARHWAELAERMTFGSIVAHLRSLLRHGVLADRRIAATISARLADERAIARAGIRPFAVVRALHACGHDAPSDVRRALAAALEHAHANVPRLAGHVVVCGDVSGSMLAPLVERRRPAATSLRCVDVAALVASSYAGPRGGGATVLSFADDVVDVGGDAAVVSRRHGGGTSCSAPLGWLADRGDAVDVVLVISDYESWSDFRGAPMRDAWSRLRERAPGAKLVLFDVQPRPAAEPAPRDDVLFVAGFSDAVFDAIASFVAHEPSDRWLREIESRSSSESISG